MKTLTCKQLDGPCDFSMTTTTEKEMMAMAWKHIAETHPEKFETTKKVMENATQEQKDQASAYFHKNWEAAPENTPQG